MVGRGVYYVRGEDLIAKEVFNKLDETIDRKCQITQTQIRVRLHNLKLEKDMSLKNHFDFFY